MRTLLDKIRTVKDVVSSVLAALAASGYPLIADDTQATIWTVAFGVASLVVTFFGGGNTTEDPHA